MELVMLKLLASIVAVGLACFAAVIMADDAADAHGKIHGPDKEACDFVYRHHLRFYLKLIIFAMIPCLVVLWIGLSK